MGAAEITLAALATARLTRLVTTDSLGDRAVRVPAERWAGADESRLYLVSGLGCPFCVGFWIGLGVLATLPVSRTRPWRLVAGALALNYVVGHVSSRID